MRIQVHIHDRGSFDRVVTLYRLISMRSAASYKEKVTSSVMRYLSRKHLFQLSTGIDVKWNNDTTGTMHQFDEYRNSRRVTFMVVNRR